MARQSREHGEIWEQVERGYRLLALSIQSIAHKKRTNLMFVLRVNAMKRCLSLSSAAQAKTELYRDRTLGPLRAMCYYTVGQFALGAAATPWFFYTENFQSYALQERLLVGGTLLCMPMAMAYGFSYFRNRFVCSVSVERGGENALESKRYCIEQLDWLGRPHRWFLDSDQVVSHGSTAAGDSDRGAWRSLAYTSATGKSDSISVLWFQEEHVVDAHSLDRMMAGMPYVAPPSDAKDWPRLIKLRQELATAKSASKAPAVAQAPRPRRRTRRGLAKSTTQIVP
jgi:hypothetical protein